MKRVGSMIVLLLSLAVTMGPVFAQEPSAELGKKLFNDPSLAGSSNVRSCNTCHKNGSGLERAGKKNNLTKTIQQCIKGPLGGVKLNESSLEVQSLKMYIQSLSK